MNTFVRFILLLLFFSLVVPVFTRVQAAPDFNITTVRGRILGPDGQPFKLATVVVTCDGQTKTGITGGQGRFIVVFTGSDSCNAGDTATVTASKDGISGSSSAPVQSRRDGRFVDLNFSVINFNVPEFGFVTGAMTLLGSLGTFFVLRKRV